MKQTRSTFPEFLLDEIYSLNQVKLNIFLRLIENKNRNVSQKQKRVTKT